MGITSVPFLAGNNMGAEVTFQASFESPVIIDSLHIVFMDDTEDLYEFESMGFNRKSSLEFKAIITL